MTTLLPTVRQETPVATRPWRRTLRRMLGAPELTFEEAWAVVRNGRAPALPVNVRPPAVRDSRHRLRAAYAAVPALASLHAALPDVVVEGSSVDISTHLDGDYWPDQRLIRVECHHPVDVIAFTLLHEFGHAVDHLVLTDSTRAELGHPSGSLHWRDLALDWHDRGEEWFAESFAHWWWPARVEPSRPAWRLSEPPLAAKLARRLFDPRVIRDSPRAPLRPASLRSAP